MLSRDQALADIDFQARRVSPDRLTRRAHSDYLQHAARMIEAYQQGIGRTRQQLHHSIERIFARQPNCPTRRIAAFCKILDDASRFDTNAGNAAALRRRVFELSAPHHPLVAGRGELFSRQREEIRNQIALRLKKPWVEIERDLFADVIECHRLRAYHGEVDPADLLAQYNVSQTQVALFDALEVTVWTSSDLNTIVRAAKLARLMHTIVREGDGSYCFRFDGPASLLRETRRYGTSIAKFLPSLIACTDWKLHARLQGKRKGPSLNLRLTSADGLTSRVSPPDEFDSEVEQKLAQKWGHQLRKGWNLRREAMIWHDGQQVFTPDFLLSRRDGTEIGVEIIGFWTPQYLQQKVRTLDKFRRYPLILAIHVSTAQQFEKLDLPPTCRIITYRSAISVEGLIEAAEEISPLLRTA